jgi:hypothetical protein
MPCRRTYCAARCNTAHCVATQRHALQQGTAEGPRRVTHADAQHSRTPYRPAWVSRPPSLPCGSCHTAPSWMRRRAPCRPSVRCDVPLHHAAPRAAHLEPRANANRAAATSPAVTARGPWAHCLSPQGWLPAGLASSEPLSAGRAILRRQAVGLEDPVPWARVQLIRVPHRPRGERRDGCAAQRTAKLTALLCNAIRWLQCGASGLHGAAYHMDRKTRQAPQLAAALPRHTACCIT